jgi:hypothetical protein
MVLPVEARMISPNISHSSSSGSADGSDSNIAVGSLETSVVVSNCFISDRRSDSMV